MKYLLAASLLMACAAAVVAAHASEFSDTFAEVGVSHIDDSYDDVSGWRVGGGAALGDHFHVLGSYAKNVGNFFDHTTNVRLGLGWSTGITESTDAVLRASYVNVGYGSGVFGSHDTDGFEVEGGVRTAFGERVETYVAVGFMGFTKPAYLTDGTGDYYARLEGFYKFSPRFGVVAKAQIADGGGEYLVGPRLSF